MNHVTAYAPAKINLFLDVGPGRLDGFHEIVTLTGQLDLVDQLEFQIGPNITKTSLTLTMEPADLCPDPIPIDDRNLVIRAVELLARETRTEIATAIHLVKRIPSQAGLGGGSSDAAATLISCNQLWNTRLSPERLSRLAALLGSDVPLFLIPAYSIGRGKGEQIQPLFHLCHSQGAKLHLVLLKPHGGLNTGQVYSRLDASPTGFPRDVQPLVQALARGQIEETGRLLFNALEKPAFELMPQLEEYKRAMALPGVIRVLMTGSGSCLFALCQSVQTATLIVRTLRMRFPDCFVRSAQCGQIDTASLGNTNYTGQ